jgi:hypothetical protein
VFPGDEYAAISATFMLYDGGGSTVLVPTILKLCTPHTGVKSRGWGGWEEGLRDGDADLVAERTDAVVLAVGVADGRGARKSSWVPGTQLEGADGTVKLSVVYKIAPVTRRKLEMIPPLASFPRWPIVKGWADCCGENPAQEASKDLLPSWYSANVLEVALLVTAICDQYTPGVLYGAPHA